MNTPIDISAVTLGTSRLTLRPFCQGDLDDFFDYASVDGVGQMAGWNPHKDKAETQKILDLFIKHKKTFALVHNGKSLAPLESKNMTKRNILNLLTKNAVSWDLFSPKHIGGKD